MPIDIVVPQIGEAISELRIVTWHKKVGDMVKKGDVLFEIDSDKAIVEVESFEDGTLVEILAPEDSAVMPQDVVARLAAAEQTAALPPPAMPETPLLNVSPLAQRVASELGVSLDAIQGSGPNGRVMVEDVRAYSPQLASEAEDGARVVASPKARRIARERGINLIGLNGTGVDGMITVRDLPAVSALMPQQIPPGDVLPMSKLRQTIAANMLASKQQVPHFYLLADVDMSEANRLRQYCRVQLGWEKAPTYTDILVRACALSLAEMPAVSRTYRADGMVQLHNVGIGVAVSVPDGLIVPTLPNADQRNLRDTSSALRELIERARTGRMKPGDFGEKSMVVSNLGMYGVDAFLAIIDMPDPMILAVGRVAERVVALDGQIVIRPMCTLSLSVDHRVLDGALGAQFLERVKGCLENPFEIMG